ncbi:MAG: MerR family DNA-binding transcriptional regulator [Candidatus Heimdallarchaeota archaeon]
MFVSTGKAAILLGVSPSTLRRWDAAKTLVPAFRTPGKHRRYQLTRLLKWSNQVPHAPKTALLSKNPGRVWWRMPGSVGPNNDAN